MEPNDQTGVIISWCLKITGIFLSFIGGVVTATWVVAAKVKGFDDRLQSVEASQKKCQGQTLVSINDKLDAIPQAIEDRMETRFNRVHERMDEIILKGNR